MYLSCVHVPKTETHTDFKQNQITKIYIRIVYVYVQLLSSTSCIYMLGNLFIWKCIPAHYKIKLDYYLPGAQLNFIIYPRTNQEGSVTGYNLLGARKIEEK